MRLHQWPLCKLCNHRLDITSGGIWQCYPCDTWWPEHQLEDEQEALLASLFWRGFWKELARLAPWCGGFVCFMALCRIYVERDIAPVWVVFVAGHLVGVWSAMAAYALGGWWARRKQPKP